MESKLIAGDSTHICNHEQFAALGKALLHHGLDYGFCASGSLWQCLQNMKLFLTSVLKSVLRKGVFASEKSQQIILVDQAHRVSTSIPLLRLLKLILAG